MKRKIILIMCLCLNIFCVNSNNLLDSVYCAMYQVLIYNDEELKDHKQENIPCRDYLYIEDISDTITVYLQYTDYEATEGDDEDKIGYDKDEEIEATEGLFGSVTVFLEDINLGREFSIYLFHYWGYGHDHTHILIKVYNKFYIYNIIDINRIIRILSSTKKKHPDILTDSMFFYYINKIVEKITRHDLPWAESLGNNIFYCPPQGWRKSVK